MAHLGFTEADDNGLHDVSTLDGFGFVEKSKQQHAIPTETFEPKAVNVKVGDVEIRTIGEHRTEIKIDDKEISGVRKIVMTMEVGSFPTVEIERIVCCPSA